MSAESEAIKRNNPLTTVVAIGVATSGRACPLELAIALQMQAWPVNLGVGWSVVCGQPVDVGREQVVERAMPYEPKYIWFIDDDTVPPVDALRKLLYVLEQDELNGGNCMAVSGIVTTKQEPAEPMVFKAVNDGPFWKWKQGEVFDVYASGFGCILIRAEVFKTLPKPWFKFTREVGVTEGEDFYFCRRLHEAGFTMKAHGGVLCRHWNMMEMKVFGMPDDSYPMQVAK